MSCRKSSAAMVCGRTRLSAKARSSGRRVVQHMRQHRHRHALVQRIGCERVGGVGRGRDDVVEAVDPQQVGRMAAAGAFGVVHVDGAALDGRQRVLAEAELVDRVGVQVDRKSRCRSAAISEPSITAAEAPKSSWILTPSAPPATDSSTAPGSEQPRPRKPKFNGQRSQRLDQLAQHVGPGAARRRNAGPGDMPIIVVVPPASACSHCCGDRKCACASTAPAVTM